MALPKDDRTISPIRSIDDIVFSGADMLNQGNVAEGQQTPPMQHGEFRVQTASNFHIVSQSYDPSTLTSLFVLAWSDVTDSADGLNQAQVAHYKVYSKLALSQNANPSIVGESEMSPCYASVTTDVAASQITFFLRPYLTNGQTVPLSDCPTCTGTTPNPFYSFTSGNVTVIIDQNRPVGGATAPGLGVINNSTLNQLTVAAGFVVAFNAAGNRTWSCGFTGSPAHGVGQWYDGTGAGGVSGTGDRIFIDGGQGHIICVSPGGGNPALVELKSTGGSVDLLVQNVTAGAAVGGGTAIPGLAVGYLEWVLNGSTIHIPYFS